MKQEPLKCISDGKHYVKLDEGCLLARCKRCRVFWDGKDPPKCLGSLKAVQDKMQDQKKASLAVPKEVK